MAKRTNPFIEDFVPQSKVHVGMKQFNNNEDRLKKVYEKTLLLLFKGAKKCPAQDITSEDKALSAADKRDKMKQLFIGKDGTLLHSGNMTGLFSLISDIVLIYRSARLGESQEPQQFYFKAHTGQVVPGPHSKAHIVRRFLSGALTTSNLLWVDCKLGLKQCTCGSSVESQCAYCEVNLCCGCQQLCVRCECLYCLRCTMNGQEGSQVCVSCYS